MAGRAGRQTGCWVGAFQENAWVSSAWDALVPAVARRAKAFGMAIHYHNPRRVHPDLEDQLEATHWDSLDQMLARMDIVSVNCPFTPATYHLLSERRLKLLQPEAYIVNAARGEIIDETALISALEAGVHRRCCPWMFLKRNRQYHRACASFPNRVNCSCSPHMGSATVEGRAEMGDKVIINIRTLFDGHRPPDRVLPGRG